MVSLVVDLDKALVYTGEGWESLGSMNGSVLLLETHLPYPHGGVEAFRVATIGGSKKTISLEIDRGKALSAWSKLYNAASRSPASLSPAEKLWSHSLPVMSLVAVLYTPDGKEYIGGVTLSPIRLLLSKNPGMSRDKAYELADKNPSKLLESVYGGGVIVVKQLRLYPIDFGKAIDNAVVSVQEILHGRALPGPRLGVEYWSPEPGYPGIYYEVYNKDLYDLSSKPAPSEWYSRIRLDNGGPAPSSDIDRLWKIYTQHFSKVYYIDKNMYSLEQALRFAYITAADGEEKGGKAWLIRPMSEFLTDLAHYRAGLYKYYMWQDTDIPVTEETIPAICLTADYNKNNPYSKYIEASISYAYSSADKTVNGLSLFGFITIAHQEKAQIRNKNGTPAYINIQKPRKCIVLNSAIGPGMLGDLAITVVDISTYGDYWVVKPAVIFVPSIYLDIDYLNPERKDITDTIPGDDKVLWGDAALYETFSDYVSYDKYENGFYYDMTWAWDTSLSGFCGDTISYYFPSLGKMLQALGFIKGAIDLFSEFTRAVQLSPYASAALTVVELVQNSLQITVLQAHGSNLVLQIHGIAQWEMGFSSTYVEVYKRSLNVLPNVATGFKPLFVEYYMTVGYEPGSPGGGDPYIPTNTTIVNR
ncbi:hypothetical protein PYJP_00910 [Pyrofollis japonicus]|nr:hypothetical protein PYJP_00910 [Pyrofollis japonicus]